VPNRDRKDELQEGHQRRERQARAGRSHSRRALATRREHRLLGLRRRSRLRHLHRQGGPRTHRLRHTTSPQDEAGRRLCQQLAGAAPAPPQQALVRVQVAPSDWSITVTTDAAGTTPCTSVARISPPRDCEFSLPAGARTTLRAQISGTVPAASGPRSFNGSPVWFGCDEGPTEPSQVRPGDIGQSATFPNGTKTCTLTLDTGRAVCLGTTDLQDAGATWACSAFYAQNPRVPIPLGRPAVTSPQETEPCWTPRPLDAPPGPLVVPCE
jgi:hypothetical protein